jgi:RNA polymerase sigma factor (sigma-70 family)
MSAHPREAELLSAAAAGDARAFEELMRPHRDRLWGVCLRVTASRADAEDALQECLIAVWKNLAKFRGESQFSTWLYRIASNAALAIVRRSRELTAEIPEREDVSVRFDEELADRDSVQRALRLLPEDFRVALVLREYGDFTYEQIAEHQGVLVATVKTRINRARTALRATLADTV